ncbi:MAG: 4Fe-4S dicluster domain-containing protein, partial [Desulfobacterales bacterium]|nr:4Fe-4S dicluster domain-containing protein [Desulfobacterales bacterium]
CQVACKSWNNLPGERTQFSETLSNPRYLNSNNFTRIIFREVVKPGGQLSWHFISRGCMHCNDPACVSACPVAALEKLASGPVIYHDDRCIGCRYCMMACPFQIPKFQWSSAVPLVRKCTFCADRLAIGLGPACSTSCPTETLLFGDRKELLKEAHHRINTQAGKYYPQVYGEKTAGGTSKLYLTAVSFEELGLNHRGFRTDRGEVPQSIYGREWMSKVPWVALGVGGLAVGLHYLSKRRAEVLEGESREPKED